MFRFFLFSQLVCLLLIASGCTHIAYNPEHEYWETELSIVSEGKAKNEDLLVSIKIDGRSVEGLDRTEEKTMAAFLLEDGPFLVSWDVAESTDMTADLTIGKTKEAHNLFWHYLTLGIVPSYKDVQVHLRLVFRDKHGNEQIVFKGVKEYQEWTSLLYSLFPPSWACFDKEKRDNRNSQPFRDMIHDVVRKMYEEEYEFFRDFGR